MNSFHATTILVVRRPDSVAVGGDGQVTMDDAIVKAHARKIRRLYQGQVLVGFAGATADAMTLVEHFEGRLEEYSGNLSRAAVELAKEWRTDQMLRRLEALMLAADARQTLLISGNGDVLEPDCEVIAVGSGGNYAQAAALALVQNTELSPAQIVQKSLCIASGICVFTNSNLTLECLPPEIKSC